MHGCRADWPDAGGNRCGFFSWFNARKQARDRWVGFIEPAIFAQMFPAAGAGGGGSCSRNRPAMGIARPAIINVTLEHHPNSLNIQTRYKKLLSAIGATGMS